jgi:hypothetical protein
MTAKNIQAPDRLIIGPRMAGLTSDGVQVLTDPDSILWFVGRFDDPDFAGRVSRFLKRRGIELPENLAGVAIPTSPQTTHPATPRFGRQPANRATQNCGSAHVARSEHSTVGARRSSDSGQSPDVFAQRVSAIIRVSTVSGPATARQHMASASFFRRQRQPRRQGT